MMYFQPEADEGEGVGAEDVDLPLQRQDVRQGPRGTLPQDVRAPRPRGGAGPCHGALHLLDCFVVGAPRLVTAGHNKRPGHRLGYSFRERRRLQIFFASFGFLNTIPIPPDRCVGYIYIKIAYVYVYIFLRCEEEYFCFGLLITYRSPARARGDAVIRERVRFNLNCGWFDGRTGDDGLMVQALHVND